MWLISRNHFAWGGEGGVVELEVHEHCGSSSRGRMWTPRGALAGD